MSHTPSCRAVTYVHPVQKRDIPANGKEKMAKNRKGGGVRLGGKSRMTC